MLLRTTLLAVAATAATAATATAASPSHPPVASVVDPATQSPVAVSFDISDASGAVVQSLACEWVMPGAEDAPCLRFQGDAWQAIDAIEEVGGVRADGRTVMTPASKLDIRRTITRRDDGTWELRSKGSSDGLSIDTTTVCDPTAHTCVTKDRAKAARAKKASVRHGAVKFRKLLNAMRR